MALWSARVADVTLAQVPSLLWLLWYSYINSGLLYTQWIVVHVVGIVDHIGSLSNAIGEPCFTDRLSEGRAS